MNNSHAQLGLPGRCAQQNMKNDALTGAVFHIKLILFTVALFLGIWVQGVKADEKIYVGAIACMECHQEQYDNFMAYSPKASSFEDIKKMEKKLSPEEYHDCFKCHTTGYGKKGGFISEAQTPELKNPGCEVCHGPGSLHAETQDPEDIVKSMTMDDCRQCHNAARINDFDFSPLRYAGGH